MIHRFSVANYYSIREEVVLDLRIPGTAPDLPSFRRSTVKPDIRLPTVAVLIGPNGSGKTTLLQALIELLRIASTAQMPESNLLNSLFPFRSVQTRSEPFRASLEFEAPGLLEDERPELFRYDLVMDHAKAETGSAATVRREALSHFPRGRPRRLFERKVPGAPTYVAREFGLSPGDERLKAIRTDVAVLPTLAMLNVPLADRLAKRLEDLRFSTNVISRNMWTPPTDLVVKAYERNPKLKSWVQARILCSDLGIRDMRIADVGDGKRLVLLDHQGLDMPVLLEAESSGTKRLFHLLPLLFFALNQTGLAVLDEIDGDLHADIAGEILRWFRSHERNPRNAQLLVTSHNVGLLDDLEKEEVFIVEKDDSGATRVHGAQDVRGLRRDTRLYPKYRAGVLGGVPRIG